MTSIFHSTVNDRPFYALIFGFLLATFLTAVALGDLRWFVPWVYFGGWARAMLFMVTVVVAFFLLTSLRSPHLLMRFTDRTLDFFHRRASGFVLFSAIAIFHGTFTSMKMMMPEIQPFYADSMLADIDEDLHFVAPWTYLTFLEPNTRLIRFFYSEIWFLGTTVTTLLVCLKQPSQLRSQYLWTFFFAWIGLGIVLAMCFMSAGPVYYDQLLGTQRFTGITEHLRGLLSEKDPSSQYPGILWTAYVNKSPGIGTGISAFPSLHLAMATLFVLTAFHKGRLLGCVMLAYLGLIMVGSVHLGWHYAIDGYVSIIATVGLWKTIGYILRAKDRRIFPVLGYPVA